MTSFLRFSAAVVSCIVSMTDVAQSARINLPVTGASLPPGNHGIAIADFNGDKKWDFLIHPALSGDVGDGGYAGELVAVLDNGNFLWRKKIVSQMECAGGIAYDMDGDGKDEVMVEGGKMYDGMTGELKKTASKSQGGECVIAYLDGKNPALVIAGTGNGDGKLRSCTAYDRTLAVLWSWAFTPPGQSCHTACAADVDGDGKDEIIVGRIVVDDNGKILHSSGSMHADVTHVGDIDWDNPGLEIHCDHTLIDGKTGKLIWDKSGKSGSYGFIGDFNAKYPGMEIVNIADDGGDISVTYNAKGEVIGKMGKGCSMWWDGSQTQQVKANPARQYMIADIIGDWRDELIWAKANTIMIETPDGTPVLKKPSLMIDRKYHLDARRGSRGINGKFIQPVLSKRITEFGTGATPIAITPRRAVPDNKSMLPILRLDGKAAKMTDESLQKSRRLTPCMVLSRQRIRVAGFR